MAFCFGDGFDLYSSNTDATLGYWEAPTTSVGSFALNTGRYVPGSSAAYNGTGNYLVKTSGSNDSNHHINCAFLTTETTIAGSGLGLFIQLQDGATNQCCIVFRQDGAVLLTSGGPTGTIRATYTGAFSVTSTWYGFEFEVIIHDTAGAFRVRKYGNTSNDFDSGAINTRGGTSNNYANRVTFGAQGVLNQRIDDFLWRSDASTVSWAGDVRCQTRMPNSDASAVWTRPTTFQVRSYNTPIAGNLFSGTPCYAGFISPGGTVDSVVLSVTVGGTGNIKCAIFACVGTALGASGSVGAILGTATAPVVNPASSSTNTFTFSSPISLPFGTLFYVGVCSDATFQIPFSTTSVSSVQFPVPYYAMGARSATTYAAFPVASPTLNATAAPNPGVLPVLTPAGNFSAVADLRQDGTVGYVSSSNPTDSDLYGIAGISSTPASTIAVTTRALLQKTDFGPRSVAMQLKSGSTTVQSTTLSSGLSAGIWTWAYRTDTTDPATGSAWTATGVNTAQIGPILIA